MQAMFKNMRANLVCILWVMAVVAWFTLDQTNVSDILPKRNEIGVSNHMSEEVVVSNIQIKPNVAAVGIQ